MQGTTVAIPARDLGETLRASLAGAVNAFLSTIPRLLGFALVLVAGWVVSSLLAKGVGVLLHAMRFNELARRSGFADFVQSMGVRTDSAGVIAGLTKWFVRVFALVVAFDLLDLPAVSNVLQRLLLWLPNLVVGLVILVIGGVAANAVSRLVRGAVAQAGLANPDGVATVAKVAVWAFAIVVAVSQLGIATTLINTLLVGVVGALALAAGLAFGLGGRDHAARLLERMGPPAQSAAPRIERPTNAGRDGTSAVAPPAVPARDLEEPEEEQFVPRSGFDRRRIARPGNDRRAAGPSAA